MQQWLKNKFPEWTKQQGNYDLCMSDDLDSLLSCLYLKSLFNYQIKWLYTFKDLYYIPQNDKFEILCVDIAIERHKTWDNHVVKVDEHDKVNPESANINAINGIHKGNYYSKYAGSTLLQILSFNDIPLPESEEGKLILLGIDSAYLGHYSKDFRAIHRRYMEQLELYDLIDLLDKYNDPSVFHDLNRKYKLKSKISVDENGYLQTDIDLAALQGFFDFRLSLPEEKFEHKHKFNQSGAWASTIRKPDVFSFALTSRNQFKYTK